MQENALNQSATITANLRNDSDKSFLGVIRLNQNSKNIDDLSVNLLENGIAKFKDFETDYLVPSYMPCRLQKAEERAKEAKLGIWAK